MTITREDAEALFAEIRTGLVNTEKLIVEAIRTRAWEALGYASFEEAWRERLSGVKLATDAMRAAVVYRLFDEGLSDEQVIRATGVGDQSTRRLREQRTAGVPSEHATTRVRAHDRGPKSQAWITFPVSEDDRRAWAALAKDSGQTLESVAHAATAAAFARMARAARRAER